MAVEWVVALQEHMGRAEHKIRALIDGYVPVGRSIESEAIDYLWDTTNKLFLWVQSFPRDEKFWSFVNAEYVLRASRLSLAFPALEGLLMIRKQVLNGDDPLEPGVLSIRKDVEAAIRIRSEARDTADQMFRGRPITTGPRPPRVIIGEICLYTYPWRINQSPASFALADWPPVLCYDHIHIFLKHLVEVLFFHLEETRVNLAVKQTPHFFEIIITHPDLRLRPETWIRLAGAESAEKLYETGGTLEPLTWNEGQGEGVVVRLPWARTEG